MPFTQKRAIELIKAGEAWEASYATARAIVVQITLELENGQITLEKAIGQINAAFVHAVPEHQSIRPLIVESEHFKRNARFNTRERERQERRRATKKGFQAPPKDLDMVAMVDEPTPEERAAYIRFTEGQTAERQPENTEPNIVREKFNTYAPETISELNNDEELGL